MIKNFQNLECRKEIVKNKHYIYTGELSSVTARKKKMDYEYYICDNCQSAIPLNCKWNERKGGIVEFPISTNRNLKIVACNNCFLEIKKAVNEAYGTNF